MFYSGIFLNVFSQVTSNQFLFWSQTDKDTDPVIIFNAEIKEFRDNLVLVGHIFSSIIVPS